MEMDSDGKTVVRGWVRVCQKRIVFSGRGELTVLSKYILYIYFSMSSLSHIFT